MYLAIQSTYAVGVTLYKIQVLLLLLSLSLETSTLYKIQVLLLLLSLTLKTSMLYKIQVLLLLLSLTLETSTLYKLQVLLLLLLSITLETSDAKWRIIAVISQAALPWKYPKSKRGWDVLKTGYLN